MPLTLMQKIKTLSVTQKTTFIYNIRHNNLAVFCNLAKINNKILEGHLKRGYKNERYNYKHATPWR